MTSLIFHSTQVFVSVSHILLRRSHIIFEKSPIIVLFPTSFCDKRCFLRLMTLPIQGSHPAMTICPSGETLTLILTIVFVLVTNAILDRRAFGWPELTEALTEAHFALFIVVLMIMQNKSLMAEQGWLFLDEIKSGKWLKFGQESLLKEV